MTSEGISFWVHINVLDTEFVTSISCGTIDESMTPRAFNYHQWLDNNIFKQSCRVATGWVVFLGYECGDVTGSRRRRKFAEKKPLRKQYLEESSSHDLFQRGICEDSS